MTGVNKGRDAVYVYPSLVIHFGLWRLYTKIKQPELLYSKFPYKIIRDGDYLNRCWTLLRKIRKVIRKEFLSFLCK